MSSTMLILNTMTISLSSLEGRFIFVFLPEEKL